MKRSLPTEMIDTVILVDDYGREVPFDKDYLIQYFSVLHITTANHEKI